MQRLSILSHKGKTNIGVGGGGCKLVPTRAPASIRVKMPEITFLWKSKPYFDIPNIKVQSDLSR